MAEPIVLSGSSLSTFLRCGHQWYLAYVERIRRPPNVKLAVGIAGHKAVETNLAQKIESRVDLPTEQVVDAFSDEYESIRPDITDSPKLIGEGKDSGIKSVIVHHKLVAPAIQPLWVEREVTYDINGIPYAGTVDLVDQHEVVRDWKFTGRKPSGDDYLLNKTGYALGYRQASGRRERGVTLDYIVRTKTPYHHPLKAGPVSDNDVRAFGQIVEGAYENINAGRFLPNGLMGQACSWCGYRDICKYRNK